MKYLIFVLAFFSSTLLKAEMYLLHKSSDGTKETAIIRISDKASIPFDINNRDYKKYLKWKEEGNNPTVILSTPPTYQELRAKEYPSIQDQQDAWFKYIEAIITYIGEENLPVDNDAKEIRNKIKAVKAKYPKP